MKQQKSGLTASCSGMAVYTVYCLLIKDQKAAICLEISAKRNIWQHLSLQQIHSGECKTAMLYTPLPRHSNNCIWHEGPNFLPQGSEESSGPHCYHTQQMWHKTADCSMTAFIKWSILCNDKEGWMHYLLLHNWTTHRTHWGKVWNDFYLYLKCAHYMVHFSLISFTCNFNYYIS